MKPLWLAALGVLAAFAVGGCTSDQYARMLIEQDTGFGKSDLAWYPKGEEMVNKNRITAARRVAMPDKVDIDVWVLDSPKQPARGTVLVLHDLRESKVAYLSLARHLAGQGFDVLLPDLRAHGRSSGKYVAFGALEKLDQSRTLEALDKDKLVADPLYVFGVGLGGAVAIQYAAIDPRVQGVVAIAPFRDMYSYGRKITALAMPFKTDQEFAQLVTRAGEIADFNPAEANTVAAAARVHCPLLLMHGSTDLTTPYSDSEAILAAAKGAKRLEQFLGGHLGVMVGRENDVVKGIERVASGRLEPASRPAQE
jgi:alpha-beta hydrolase superfamily lysophospholipase